MRLVDSAFVEAMQEGWLVMIDEANAARDVALLSINATLDGRLALYLPATAETVVAQPGNRRAARLQPRPSRRGGDRHSRRLALPLSGHARGDLELGGTVKLGAPEPLVAAAARLDQLRMAGEDGLEWTPQFRDLESLPG